MDIKRRTVEENGVNVIIPSPTDDITWYKRLTSLPYIQTFDILFFFMTYCKWDSHRLQSYKNDNGIRLFSSNHIEHVQISETLQNNYLYIKSDSIPETRQTSDPYKTWVSTSVRTNCVWKLYLCCVSFMFKYCIYMPSILVLIANGNKLSVMIYIIYYSHEYSIIFKSLAIFLCLQIFSSMVMLIFSSAVCLVPYSFVVVDHSA